MQKTQATQRHPQQQTTPNTRDDIELWAKGVKADGILGQSDAIANQLAGSAETELRFQAGPPFGASSVGALLRTSAPKASGGAPWSPAAYDSWLSSLDIKPARGNTAAMDFQRAVAGPTEYHVQGLANKPVWVDGIKDTSIVEAKAVVSPNSSPQLGNAPSFIHERYLREITSEFGRMKSTVLDPSNPWTSVEVRVNTEASVPFWESFLENQGIPGRVVAPGGSAPAVAPAERPGFLRANAGALGLAAGISAISGVATAITRLGEKVAVQSVTDSNTDPVAALRSVEYLRQRFDANHSGLWYAVSNTPRYKEAQKEEAAGHKWLDQVEDYWRRRLLPGPRKSSAAPFGARLN